MSLAKLFFFTIVILLKFNTVIFANQLPVAKKGVLDLRLWNFEKNGAISLDGEWEFYWNQFLEPEYFKENNSQNNLNFIHVPENWKNYRYNKDELPNTGFATYRLKVLINGKKDHLKIFYFLQMISSKCYVNGKPIISAGEIGKTKEESTISLIHKNIDFVAETDTLEIIIQVSNFQNPKGGLFSEIKLGTAEQIHNVIDKKTISDSFLLGIFMLMALYHIVLFLLRRKNLSNVFFALSCFGFFLNYGFTEGVFSSFLPNLEFDYVYRFVFISLTIIVAAFFLFVRSIFAQDYNKRIAQIIGGIGIFFILTALSPKKILHSEAIVAFTQIYLILGSLYTIFVIIKASIKKREDARILLLGLLIFIVSMVNDTLHNLNIINTVVLVNFGLLTFFLFQSYIISARFSRAFNLSETLRVELKDTNENLEDIVNKRTHKIEQQKEEIQTQNEKLIELGRFKQGMTSMIVHDLKNPLNTILHASDSEIEEVKSNKKGIIRSTGRQMLNLILNILDINKFEEASIHLTIENDLLTDLFNSASQQVPFLLEQKSIKLVDTVANDYMVSCDREIIERVFVNLLTNAIKFSPHNSKIELQAHPINSKNIPKEFQQVDWKEKNNGQLLIALKDYGTGIKKDVISKIFQQFKQIEATDSGSTKSTGLGLSFCKLAVEAHEGRIGVISKPNEGSTFWFTLKMSDEIKEIKTNTTSIVKEESLILSKEERSKLKDDLTDLNQLEFYEITSIKKILANISSDSSNSIKEWKYKVELAVKNCNEEEYEKLIKSV